MIIDNTSLQIRREQQCGKNKWWCQGLNQRVKKVVPDSSYREFCSKQARWASEVFWEF